MGTTLRSLLGSSHPEPALAVTALATILAATGGRGTGSAWVLGAIGTGQLYVGWSNDYLDRRRDASDARPDKPLAQGHIDPRLVGAAAVLALPTAIALSLASGVRATAAHTIALAAATAYNLGLKSTPFSVLPYAAGFAALPAFVAYGIDQARGPAPRVIAAGALLGSGAHFAQVLGDIERDRAHRRLGLPQRVGRGGSAVVSALLLGAAATTVSLPPAGAGPTRRATAATTLGLAGAVLTAGLANRPRAAFRLALLCGASAVATVAASGSVLRRPAGPKPRTLSR